MFKLNLLLALLALPASGEPAPRKLRVLVHNIYGRKEHDCTERYKALAARVLSASPAYDIVALNEHWKVPYDRWYSCDADVLTKAIEADGRYSGAGRSVKHQPDTTDVLQVAGGNSIFTLHKIIDAYQSRFVNSRDVPLSGSVMARVELAPGMAVDLWNVHLEAGSDGCDDDCRWEQATDLGSEIELFSGLPEKGQKGNPVLIVGDFNTGGPMSKSEKPPFAGNGGYGNVVEAIGSPRDVWLEAGSGTGFTYDCTLNSTQKCEYRERIDYVFLPESPKIVHPSSEWLLKPVSIEVVRWKTPSGVEVSDHYGLDAVFELRARPKAEARKAVGEAAARIKGLLAQTIAFDSR